MKHLLALITYLLIISISGIGTRHAKNMSGASVVNLPPNKKKYFSTDTIKPIKTNIGNPYITNYNPGFSDQQIWSICQDFNGQMIFAHRQGITIFNGNSWTQLKLPSIPFTLKSLPEKQIILVGCDNQFGYIKQSNNGIYEYFALSDKNLRPGEIVDIKLSDTQIFFYSEESLTICNKETLKTENSWFVQDGVKQNGIIQFSNNVFISKKNKGIYKINPNGKKDYINNSKALSAYQIAFSIPLSDNKMLVGNYGNKLYTFNGKNIKEYSGKATDYISESQLVNGISLNDKQFALSTILGGTIIINKKDGNIADIINYQNGLPDNEIFAIGNDAQGGLWLSHGFGISRVNCNLPVKDYNYYPGIEGKLIDIIEFENTTYIATTEGVFYLDTIADIKEFDIFIKKTSIKKGGILKSNTKENVQETNGKKSIFQRWKEKRENRKKKNEGKTVQVEDEKKPKNNDKDSRKKRKKIVYKKETVKVLSLSYVFKKVENISGKCKQLVKYNNSILVASNNGLYEIKNKKSQQILKNIYVNTISPSATNGLFYIGYDNGITAIKYDRKEWQEYPKIQPEEFEDEVVSIAEDENQNLWVGSNDLIYFFKTEKHYRTKSFEIYDFDKDYPDKFSIRQIENKVFFLSSRQIYKFNRELNRIEPSDAIIPSQLPFFKYIISQPEITWFKNEDKWVYISDKYQLTAEQTALLNLFENIQNIRVDQKENIWVVDGKNNLYKILPMDISKSYLSDFKVYIQEIQNDHGNFVPTKNIEIGSEINSLTFKISAPYYLRPDGLRYQYFIKGAMNGWTDWKQSQDFDFLLQPGDYKILVRAKNIFGNISNSDEYNVKVKSPVWLEPWFMVTATAGIILFLALVVFLLQRKKERRLQKANKLLETKVEERTLEIKKQKEQIEFKNREITDSLNYASQIQAAILPPIKMLNDALSEAFVFNKPKDIVSGDYYWANRINGQLVVTAADCTGHGVPGAFLSMLGVTFLNEITNKMDYMRANLILEKLRTRVIKSLHQEGYDKKRLDGIDLSLAVFDLNKMKLQFSGANNPLYLIRDGQLTEFKGNRMPIGIHSYVDKPFTNHEIEVKRDDLIYMFSDGFIDQFGGEYGRKFLSRNFKALLIEISVLPLAQQNRVLEETFHQWKGKYDQIDDILIVGLKI